MDSIGLWGHYTGRRNPWPRKFSAVRNISDGLFDEWDVFHSLVASDGRFRGYLSTIGTLLALFVGPISPYGGAVSAGFG